MSGILGTLSIALNGGLTHLPKSVSGRIIDFCKISICNYRLQNYWLLRQSHMYYDIKKEAFFT